MGERKRCVRYSYSSCRHDGGPAERSGARLELCGGWGRAPWTPLDEAALQETVAEVDKGWLAECGEVDMKRQFIAKQFPIQQKNKMRLIDDFSVCGVNSTVGLPEKLRVESVDQIVAILLAMMRSVGKTQKLPWVGRTFDLKSAYKQFGVSESDANLLKMLQLSALMKLYFSSPKKEAESSF